MMEKAESFNTRELLLQQCEAAKLKLAFFDFQETEIQRMELAFEQDEELQQLFEYSKPKVFELIRHRIRSTKIKKTSIELLRRMKSVVMFVFVVIAIVTISAASCFALVPEFQSNVRGLLINMTGKYTEISVDLNPNYLINIPDSWAGDYFPSYIPEGYVLDQTGDETASSFFVEYTNSEQRRMAFFELDVDSRINIDTENAKISVLTIHDADALAVEKTGKSTISWTEYNKCFIVVIDGELSQAITVARSVKRVR